MLSCTDKALVYCGVLGTTPRHRVLSLLLLTQLLLCYHVFTEVLRAVISIRAFPESVQSSQYVRWNSEKLLVGFPSTRMSSLVPAISIQFGSPLLLPKAPIQTTSSTVTGMQLFLAHPKV